MSARIGVITFPGTLDDVDAARAVRLAGAEAVSLWHADADLKGVDAVVVPGGFSYGDYLRCGAIAKFAPVMGEVVAAAAGGMPVLGICEGRYVASESVLDELEAEGRVVFRYVDNINGSMRGIAGVSSANGRVVGLMPHPEHATEALTGPSDDGLGMFYSALDAVLAV